MLLDFHHTLVVGPLGALTTIWLSFVARSELWLYILNSSSDVLLALAFVKWPVPCRSATVAWRCCTSPLNLIQRNRFNKWEQQCGHTFVDDIGLGPLSLFRRSDRILFSVCGGRLTRLLNPSIRQIFSWSVPVTLVTKNLVLCITKNPRWRSMKFGVLSGYIAKSSSAMILRMRWSLHKQFLEWPDASCPSAKVRPP